MCQQHLHLYINLDRYPDRAKKFEATNSVPFQMCGMQRLSAVDGPRELPPSKPGELKRGERGCIGSHKKAWKRLTDSSQAYGVVLEDDADLASEYIPLLDTVLAEASQVCEKPLVFFGRTTWTDVEKEPQVSPHLHRVTEPSFGMHAYAISRAAAAHLGAQHIDKALDVYLWKYLQDSPEVCLLRTSHQLSGVNHNPSSTQEN